MLWINISTTTGCDNIRNLYTRFVFLFVWWRDWSLQWILWLMTDVDWLRAVTSQKKDLKTSRHISGTMRRQWCVSPNYYPHELKHLFIIHFILEIKWNFISWTLRRHWNYIRVLVTWIITMTYGEHVIISSFESLPQLDKVVLINTEPWNEDTQTCLRHCNGAIVNCENDKEVAFKNLLDHIVEPVDENSPCLCPIDSVMFANSGLEQVELLLEKSTFIFLLVMDTFIDDLLCRMLKDELVSYTIENCDERWKIIPVSPWKLTKRVHFYLIDTIQCTFVMNSPCYPSFIHFSTSRQADHMCPGRSVDVNCLLPFADGLAYHWTCLDYHILDRLVLF